MINLQLNKVYNKINEIDSGNILESLASQHYRVIIFFMRPNNNVAIAVPPRDALTSKFSCRVVQVFGIKNSERY